MLYLLQVYALVIIVVAIPLVLLYLGVTALRSGVTAARFMIGHFSHVLAVRPPTTAERWSHH
jgi:hypothetical protein